MIFPGYTFKRIVNYLVIIILILLTQQSIAQSKLYSHEVGLHFGNFFVAGDVDHSLLPGYGTGIHYRVAVNHALSFRPQFFYGITHGLDAKPITDGILNEPGVFEGYSITQPWFYSYQTKLIRFNIQGLLELTNLGPQHKYKDFNIFILGGFGFNSHGTWLNLRDADGEIYTDLLTATSFEITNDYNTASGRKAIRRELQSVYDDTYETPSFKKEGEFRLGDETNIALEASLGAGISYRISSSFNISLEHEIMISNNDYLDGLLWRTQYDVTNKNDIGHYTSLRVAFNLKSHQKKEPQYWINPWNDQQQFMDSLESRVSQLEKGMMDSDNDGVVDAIDQQSNSPANCHVDAKGITLDSDRDGIADCYDKFPFGDKKDIEAIVADYLKSQSGFSQSSSKEKVSDTTLLNSRIRSITYKNTLLPFVFFDSDSYLVNDNQYPALGFIADFVKSHKIICISIIGHADHKAEHAYNNKLGLERAEEVIRILREEFGITNVRFIPQSQGEETPLITNPDNSAHDSINRRVGFKFCEGGAGGN